MIAPMKRVHIVLLERERRGALHDLRELGVVHLEPVAGRGQDHEDLVRKHALVERALSILSQVKTPAKPGAPQPQGVALDLARRSVAAAERQTALHEELAGLSKELDRLRTWGDFDADLLRETGSGPLSLRVAECPLKRLPALAQVEYVRLESPKGIARLAILGSPPDLPQDLIFPTPPQEGPQALRDRMQAVRSEVESVGKELVGLAAGKEPIQRLCHRLAQDLAMETFRSGIEQQGPVAYLSGWVPAADAARLQTEARSRAWGLLTDDPAPEDSPPTKVLRNPVVRMIAPVFQFLGTVPGYREYDISGWFLGFFALYFAMIFGDGGYGIILLIAAVAGAVKAKAAGKRLSDGLRLLLVLALSTVAWGTVTATWFALPTEHLPAFLLAPAIPAFRGDNPDSTVNIMVFCFSLGVLQLSIAHLKNIVRDFPNPKFFAQVGSLAMIAGMYTVVLNLIIDPKRFPIPGWALYVIGGGFLLVFLFGNWSGSFLRALAAAFQGFIPTFLGTVGVFADIASYMRLWAVGLAGVYISQTVNGMAAGLFGDPGGHLLAFLARALAGTVLIVAGHGLNLVMTVLSVVVHGIRLNMLEFSGHLGMEWSGYPYDPFRRAVRDTDTQEGKETS